MSNNYKIISVLIALVIVLSGFTIVPLGVSAEEVNTASTCTTDEAFPDFGFSVLDDGTAKISPSPRRFADIPSQVLMIMRFTAAPVLQALISPIL